MGKKKELVVSIDKGISPGVSKDNLTAIYYPGWVLNERGEIQDNISKLEKEIAKYEKEHGEIPLVRGQPPIELSPEEKENYDKTREMSLKKYLLLPNLRDKLESHHSTYPSHKSSSLHQPMDF